MTRKERFSAVLAYYRAHLPATETELNYTTTFELLVAVVLSAQCTDKRINQVTPALFRAYPTPAAMSQATEEDVLAYIKSVSYPNSKARHLVGLARMLVSDFDGQVPSTLEELTRLPGVGTQDGQCHSGRSLRQGRPRRGHPRLPRQPPPRPRTPALHHSLRH